MMLPNFFEWDNFIALLNDCGLSDAMIFMLGTAGVHIVTFWGFNLFLFACYRFNWFSKQRIQGGQMPTTDLIWSCICNRLIFHFVLQPVALYFLYPFFVWCGISLRGPIPHATIWIRDFFVANICTISSFYWIHRALHHKWIYKYIHKQHHNFNISIGIAAEHAHPVEDIVANYFPTLLGCLLMGSHVVVLWSWISFRLFETIDSHSGFHFEWSLFNNMYAAKGANRHDYHHSHNQGCYGAYVWDRLMGTDLEYIEHEKKMQQERLKEI